MVQVKTFVAKSDEIINKVLEQVPAGAFRDLKLLGEFNSMAPNHYMLSMEVDEPIEIEVPISTNLDTAQSAWLTTFYSEQPA